jgi:hypothetical protein
MGQLLVKFATFYRELLKWAACAASSGWNFRYWSGRRPLCGAAAATACLIARAGIEINTRIGIVYGHVISAGLGGEPMLDEPGGTLTAILPATARYDHGLLTGHWSDLPAGFFSESGTNTSTTVLTMRNRESA